MDGNNIIIFPGPPVQPPCDVEPEYTVECHTARLSVNVACDLEELTKHPELIAPDMALHILTLALALHKAVA